LNHGILLLVAAWRKEDGIASCYQPEAAAILSPAYHVSWSREASFIDEVFICFLIAELEPVAAVAV